MSVKVLAMVSANCQRTLYLRRPDFGWMSWPSTLAGPRRRGMSSIAGWQPESPAGARMYPHPMSRTPV
jgi:hypothetical protein